LIQQRNLFEIVNPEYIEITKDFYGRHKNKGAPVWEQLDLRLQEVMTDMRYQGRLRGCHLTYFEANDLEEIVKLIRSDPVLMEDESGRNRIKYLRGK
jgi:hypothetical protein